MTRTLCACGCRRHLDPCGPSLYFVSPGCQRRWHSVRADQPHEVYARRDAATAPGYDRQQVPLTDPSPAPCVPWSRGLDYFNLRPGRNFADGAERP